MVRAIVVASVFLACSALVHGARADAEADRTALFKEGVALAEKNDWAGAAERFRRVVVIRSAPKALFTLGQAEQHLGRFAAAKAAFERAKKDSGPADAAVAKAAADALKEVTPHVGHVIVSLPADASGATIAVDGATVAPGEPGLECDPGAHHVHAEIAGKKAFDADVQVVDGGRAEALVRFDPLVVAPPPPAPLAPVATPSREGDGAPSIVPPLAIAGAGVAFVAVGAILFATGRGSYDSAAASCGATCSDDAKSKASSARGQMLAGDVMLFGGAAVAAAGGTWLLLRTLKKPEGATQASALVSPRGAFGSVSIRY